eukprot:snap_masked-scaffold_4-processed-gene-11.48-mRNA-1 protein AED:1.00 eAED:1.00 QI:0/0/0/0/1/1/2/0/172
MKSSLIETKIKLNGTRKIFNLELIKYISNDYIVGKFYFDKLSSKKYSVEPGSVSYGFWPLHSNKNKFTNFCCYRFRDPKGIIKKYRFDATRRNFVSHDNNDLVITFEDLILDATVDVTDGFKVSIEDEEEIEEAHRKNLLSKLDVEILKKFKNTFTNQEKTKDILSFVDTLY